MMCFFFWDVFVNKCTTTSITAFSEEYLQYQCAGISSNPIDLEEYEL